jgi:hypothetical protein
MSVTRLPVGRTEGAWLDQVFPHVLDAWQRPPVGVEPEVFLAACRGSAAPDEGVARPVRRGRVHDAPFPSRRPMLERAAQSCPRCGLALRDLD